MTGVFVGLTTLDLIYRAESLPQPNQKVVASDYLVSAGGPATNAAVAFSYLAGSARVVSAVGSHPLTHLIRADLDSAKVALMDLAPTRQEPPPVSSIIVTEATGERSVISINASRIQVGESDLPPDILEAAQIVLLDGHQIVVGRAIAAQARVRGVPVVIDGGSWKPGFETVLALADYAICSANFYPPECQTPAQVVAYLQQLGVPNIALTRGEQPILYWSLQTEGRVAVPEVPVVDTLGAGDIFHGAFCAAILRQDFVAALATAAKVAAHSCQSFGTRAWMRHEANDLAERLGYWN